jgi:PAS domain S-box-containing protein
VEKIRYILSDSSLNGSSKVPTPVDSEWAKSCPQLQSSDAVFVVNPITGKIVEANDSAAQIVGYAVSELQGMSLDYLLSVAEISSRATEADPSRGNGRAKANLKRQNGTAITVDIKTSSVRQGQNFLRLIFVRKPTSEETPMPAVIRSGISTLSASKDPTDDSEPVYEFPNIIGKSAKIRRICQLIGQVAKTDCTVLVQGESGTGKEIVAQAIHYHSSRSKAPFVKVNCAALSETLLESELFGHVKGAFTGAIRDHKGRFMQADGGTILLDEISCMSLPGQAKFLRVLQEREFEPVGSSVTSTVNVRVIVASNMNLETAVSEGAFREDLYYRLNVFPIFMPALRDKREDIPLLAQHFLKKCNLAVGKDCAGFAPETLALMSQYDWPGNVRELENAVEHAVIVGKGPRILPSDLPSNFTLSAAKEETTYQSAELGLREQLNLLEKQIITDALLRANGIKKRAAALLQIDPRNFPYLLRKHNLIETT